MLWTLCVGLAALLGTATADNAVYRDPDTGLTFTSNFELYKADGRGITFRIAIPDSVPSNTAYDAVLQVVVPNDVGWTGLAWGGEMTDNPLLAAWKGNNVVLSPRWADQHVQPTPSTTSTYTLFKTGTKSNSTHWQFTALCKGCTSWTDPAEGTTRYLSPRGGNRLAFAYAAAKPGSVNSASSTLPVHDVMGYWSHDFTQAANVNFSGVVAKLAGGS